MTATIESLIENSKSAIISCIEIHNKPRFDYRYEICAILAINGWELILKAYIAEFHKHVRIINKDGTTKPFDDCLSFVSTQLGKNFRHIEENLKVLYEYRCNVIHFYKEKIDIILFSILNKSILNYNWFLSNYFNIDLSEELNLVLLPIGFKPICSPIDFLSKKSEYRGTSSSIQQLIESIMLSTISLNEEGIEDSILAEYTLKLENETRIKNADIIVGITSNESESKISLKNVLGGNVNITNDEGAKKISIEEETVFKTIYTLTYNDVKNRSREIFSDFIQNARFNQVMKIIKDNPNLYKRRYIDVNSKTGVGKDYYSQNIFDELSKYYKIK